MVDVTYNGTLVATVATEDDARAFVERTDPPDGRTPWAREDDPSGRGALVRGYWRIARVD